MIVDGDGSSLVTYTYDGPHSPGFIPMVSLGDGDGPLTVIVYVDGDLVDDFLLRDGEDVGFVMSIDDILDDVIESYEHGTDGPIDKSDGMPWVNRLRQWADAIEARCEPDGICCDSDGV